MATVQEAEAALTAAKAKCDFLGQQEVDVLGRLREEQRRLSGLLAVATPEKELRRGDDEIQRLTNRLGALLPAKQQATADLEECERRVSQAVADAAKAELDGQIPALDAAAQAVRDGFRVLYEAWQVRRKLEEERLEIGRRANVTVQSSKGEILPRMVWYKTDVGTDHAFREWLQHLLEIAPLLPLHRPPEEEDA